MGHHIVHNNSFLGAIGGLIGGLIVGIAVGALVVATGARHWVCWLPPLLPVPGISWWICRWRSDGSGSRWASETGQIVEGSPNVFLKEKR